MELKIAGTVYHSHINGPGTRYVIFFQGCPHHCYNCHNPDTHNLAGGHLTTTERLINSIRRTKLLDGVTISGGEPFFQAEALLDIVMGLKALGYDIWVYTGNTFENLKTSPVCLAVFDYIDVLVDGRYLDHLKSEDCIWRGSSNQRLIDVPASLISGKVVEVENGGWKDADKKGAR